MSWAKTPWTSLSIFGWSYEGIYLTALPYTVNALHMNSRCRLERIIWSPASAHNEPFWTVILLLLLLLSSRWFYSALKSPSWLFLFSSLSTFKGFINVINVFVLHELWSVWRFLIGRNLVWRVQFVSLQSWRYKNVFFFFLSLSLQSGRSKK